MQAADSALRQRLKDLTAGWLDRARQFEEHGCGHVATTYARATEELGAVIADWEDEQLTIADAAEASGYSEEHLRRLVRDGKLPAKRADGTRSHIRIRRADVPTKANGRPAEREKRDGDDTYDPDEDARSIARHMRR